MSLLSDNESSSDERDVGVKLKINEKFADRFVREERAKELHRAKELLKNADLDEDEDSDSESESEDEDAEQLSTGLDLKIIQTINMLRKKDPKIYDPNAKWFDDPKEDDPSSDEDDDGMRKQSKKKKFKDVLREQLLESDAAGGLGDGDGIEASSRGVLDTVSKRTLVYNAEQEKIRQAFLKTAAGKGESDSDDDEEDGVLKVKSKSAQELREEEQELQKALKEMRELAARNERKEEAKQQKNKNKNKTKVLELDNTEGFLEDYLEKQMWKDQGSQGKARKGSSLDDEDVEEDEEEIEEMERFESKYNFRFEELQDQKNSGGAVEVMGHAREVQGSMRRADDKRKQQRESRKERKEKERRQQEAELRRLKNLKRQELRERLKQISKMSGLGDIELSDDEDEAADTGLIDAPEEEQGKKGKKSRRGGKRARENKLKLSEDFLDEDWDPEKHEKLMAEQFGDDYYAEGDADFNIADMDDAEAYERYLGDDGLGEIDYEDEDGDDGAYEDEGEEEAAQPARSKEEQRQARAELRKTAAAMEDELYQLDYEDIVAGLPCRFKYKQVEQESFGLTAEDILLADDSELNKYVSLKKISPYVHHSGYNDAELSKKRKRLRESVKERLAREAEEAEKAGQQLKGTKPKVKPEATQEAVEEEAVDAEEEDNDGVAGEGKKRKRKRRKGANAAAQLITKDSALAGQSTLAPTRATAAGAGGPKASASQDDKAESTAERGGDKDKEKEKKKAKKSGKKKELSTQEKRMSLYR